MYSACPAAALAAKVDLKRPCGGGLRATDFSEREGSGPVPPLGLVGSVAIFGAGALLLFLTTRVVVPTLVSGTGAEPVVPLAHALG